MESTTDKELPDKVLNGWDEITDFLEMAKHRALSLPAGRNSGGAGFIRHSDKLDFRDLSLLRQYFPDSSYPSISARNLLSMASFAAEKCHEAWNMRAGEFDDVRTLYYAEAKNTFIADFAAAANPPIANAEVKEMQNLVREEAFISYYFYADTEHKPPLWKYGDALCKRYEGLEKECSYDSGKGLFKVIARVIQRQEDEAAAYYINDVYFGRKNELIAKYFDPDFIKRVLPDDANRLLTIEGEVAEKGNPSRVVHTQPAIDTKKVHQAQKNPGKKGSEI